MQRARLPESACCMSRHLPSPFVFLRSLAGHAPAVLCVLLLALLSACLLYTSPSPRDIS
ncbi:pilus assembly protein PilZ, partial [Pseudomonas aeruginosa]|nr:pilus assembly protein PilZ [Pseudomonas aeruginosa]